MASYSLSLSAFDLTADGSPLAFGAANAMLYVAQGQVGHAAETMQANTARYLSKGVSLRAVGAGARVLCFSLAPDIPADASVLLTRRLELDPADEYLMRCDRVDFPPGGVAYHHTHQGPGIRCLLKGHLTVETEGHAEEIEPGGAWFEAGPAPVLATASKTEDTAFVRVMVLPRALLGKSSIRYVRPEDAEKPKLQRYTVFQDVPIEL